MHLHDLNVDAVTMSKAKYVLESCLIFDELHGYWIEQLSVDALFIQTVIFMAQIYFDIMGGRNCSHPSQIHLKTLQLLREKLSYGSESTQVADPTVFAVVNLAVHAHMSGEVKSATHHLEGTRKIIDLRGGLKNLTQIKLLMELFRLVVQWHGIAPILITLNRCDIGMALHTGANPLFPPDGYHSQISVLYPNRIFLLCEKNRIFDDLDGLDDDIAKAWQFMASFCSSVNLAAEARGRIPWESFLSTMTSLMYSLLHMSFDVNSVNEAIRLGLLSLSSHIFLQWKVARVTYAHLTVSYRKCLHRLECSNRISPHLLSWLLMVGAVSVFEQPDHSWLRPRLRASIESCGVESWSEMQDILGSLLWIPLVLEKPGKDFFDSAIDSK